MTRSLALRILTLAVAIGLVGQALLVDHLFGVDLVLLSVALLLAAVVVRPVGARFDRPDAWLPVAALAVVAGVAIRADPLLTLIDVGVGCLLLGASIAAIGGLAVTRRSVAGIVTLGMTSIAWLGAGVLRVTTAARRPAADEQPLRRHVPPWAAALARGLLIAIPFLLVFTVLFASADAVFASLTGRLLDWDIDLAGLPIRLAVTFLIAWVVAGLLAIAAGDLQPWWDDDPYVPRPQSLGAAAATDPLRSGVLPRLGSIEAVTVLVAVDALFAVFVVVQFAYLFGGLDTLAATGLPYAQYARSGFFELVAVAVLAGGLLATIHAATRPRSRALVGAGVALAGLTAVVLASALLRLRIYQDAYGWTELRFYVLATIVWLAIGIAITAVLLVRDRMAWLLHGLGIAAIAVLVAINVVGPSRVIAGENVARLLDPSRVPPDGRAGLDVGYVGVLGDDAVPALVTALPALPPSSRIVLLLELQRRRDALAAPEATDWPAWNLGRMVASEALAQLPAR